MKTEQAALLNSLMYYDAIVYDKTKSLGDNLIDMQIEKPFEWDEMIKNCPGVMGSQKSKMVVNSILLDPDLKNLQILESTRETPYDNNPVMMCLLDKKNKKAIFAYRGTSGREWLDNSDGFLRESSILQKDALHFFEDTLEKHKLIEKGYNCYVTGHSKGGNKAMYVALKNENVKECLAFDGQGFSNEFMEENKNEINERKHKITNYAADRDYVSALGNQPCKCVFFETNKPLDEEKLMSKGNFYNGASKLPFVGFLFAHTPGAYFHFDENENIKMNNISKQSPLSQEIQDMSLCMMNRPYNEKAVYFNSIMGILQALNTNEPISESRMLSISEIKTGMNQTIDFMRENGFNKALLEAARSKAGNALIESTIKTSIAKRNEPLKEVLHENNYNKLTDEEVAIYQDKKNPRLNFVGVTMGRKQLGRVSEYERKPQYCDEKLESLSQKKEVKRLYMSKAGESVDYICNDRLHSEEQEASVMTIVEEKKKDNHVEHSERVEAYNQHKKDIKKCKMTDNQKAIMAAMVEAEKINYSKDNENEFHQ